MKMVGRQVRIPLSVMIGFLLFMVGGGWLLYGIAFEDPFMDWFIRGAVFLSGLILLIVYRRKIQPFK